MNSSWWIVNLDSVLIRCSNEMSSNSTNKSIRVVEIERSWCNRVRITYKMKMSVLVVLFYPCSSFSIVMNLFLSM